MIGGVTVRDPAGVVGLDSSAVGLRSMVVMMRYEYTCFLLFLLSGSTAVFECVIKMQTISLAKFYTLLRLSAVPERIINTSVHV